MTDTKQLKHNQQMGISWKKVIIRLTVVTISFYILAILTSLILQAYEVRSPIIIQNPFVLKIYSPKPKISKPIPQKKAEVTPQATPMARVPAGKEPVKQLVCKYFGADCEVATAVFIAESGLRAEAKGYNCYYTNDAGKQYSDACQAEDRARAWSVDCGIAQINVAGHECPTELLEEESNIKRAFAMYERRGFQPWVAHNTGRHLAFLVQP